MNAVIPDFTDSEQKRLAQLLQQRYGKTIPFQLADSELRLATDRDELTLCPALYWSERGAQFVVCKVAASRYRCLFFYTEAEQFGTGRVEYSDLDLCVTTLLQVQADHERQSAGVSSGATAASLAGDDEYHGPVMI